MVNIIKPDIEGITSDFHDFGRAQDAYQGSEEQQLEEYTKAHEEHVAPLAEKELEKQNENKSGDSILQNIFEIPQDLAVGVVRAAGEGVQALGGPQNVFKLNDPDDTFSAIMQTGSQFIVPYLGVVKGVSAVTKVAGILKKSPKLKTATDAMIAGMPVDAFAFDPQDGNIFNFAISTLGVSEDSRAGAAIKEYLAVKIDDPDALARAKNALSGVVGTVLFERFIKLMGGTIKAGTRAVKKIAKEDVDYFKSDPSAGDTVFGKQDVSSTPIEKEIFSPEDIEIAEKTARASGAVGSKAILPRLLKGESVQGLKNIEINTDSSILNFGSGPKEAHTKILQDSGFKNVTSFDHNLNPEALDKTYDTIFASNVLNVQNSKEALNSTLNQLQNALGKDGQIIVNLPSSPRKKVFEGMSRKEGNEFLEQELSKKFNVEKLNTNAKQDPVFKLTRKTEVSDEGTAKELADTLAEDFVDNRIHPMRDLPEEELAYVGSKLDNMDAAIYRESNKEVEDFASHYYRSSDEEKNKYIKVFTDAIEGKTLSDIDLDLLNPFNITKLNSTQERLSVISQLGEIMKDKLPRNASKQSKKARRRFLDEEINRITKYWGVKPEAFVKHLRAVTGDVESAISYIQSSKLITDIQVQKGLKLGRSFLKSKDPKDYEAYTAAVINSVESARAASGLGTAFGRALAEHKHIAEMGDLASQTDLMKAKMMNEVITSTPELGKKRVSVLVKLDELAEFERKENPKRFSGKKDLSYSEKADRNVKRLEKLLKDMKAGKETPEKRARRIDEQEILDQIKAFKAEKKLNEIFSAEQLQTRARFKSTLMSTRAKTRDVLSEIYINGLLSSVKTSAINVTGNASAIMSSIIDRWYAGATNISADGVTLGEAAQLTWSYVASMPDFWRTFTYSLKHGPSDGAVKLDMVKPHDRAITPELFNAQGNTAKAIDYLGKVVNFPGRALLSADESFKMLNYRAEVNALAYRKAKDSVGAIGDKRILAEKIADIKNNMFDHPDIMEQAKGFSEINTFTNKLPEVDRIDFNTGEITQVGGLSRTFKKLIDRDPTGMMRIFIPFFQTPVNLLLHASKRTPFLRNIGNTLENELKSQNPATKQLAEARIATGNMMWTTAIGLAMTGNFTGAPPNDIDLRRRQEEAMGGAFWYSYMTDDGWVNYNRLDPIGIIMSGATTLATMAKSLITLTKQGGKSGYDQEIFDAYQATFSDAVIGLTRMITDRHYLQGFGNMIDLATGDQRGMSRALGNVASAIDPTSSFYSSFRRGFNRGIDPVRETKIKQEDLSASDPITAGYQAVVQALDSMFSTSQSLIPGIGSERPASINLVGEKRFFPGTSTSDELHVEPLEVISNLTNTMFNPFSGGTRSKSAIMNKLAYLNSTLQGPELVTSINGVKLSQEEHQFFAETWTEMNKLYEKRAGSKSFDNMPEGAQLEELEMTIRMNKEIAQIQTETMFPRITEASDANTLNDIMSMSTETIPKSGSSNLFNLGN